LNGQQSSRASLGRRWGVPLVKVAVSILLITWLLHRIGLENMVHQFSGLRWVWLAVSLATIVCSNVLGAMQWYLLLQRYGARLRWWQVLSYYHVGLFFNNFLLGYISGDAFRVYDINKTTGDLTSAVSTVFLDRLLGFFALTTLAMAMGLYWIQSLASRQMLYLIAVILAGWILALVVLFDEKTARRAFGLVRWMIPTAFYSKLKQLYFGIHSFRKQRRLLVGLFGLSMVVQALRILTHYGAARALSAQVDLVLFFIFIPVVALLSSLPISLGGIGVREQSAVVLFGQAAIPPVKVTAFELLAYLVGVASSVPGGLIFMLRREKKTRSSKRAIDKAA